MPPLSRPWGLAERGTATRLAATLDRAHNRLRGLLRAAAVNQPRPGAGQAPAPVGRAGQRERGIGDPGFAHRRRRMRPRMMWPVPMSGLPSAR